MDNIQLALLLEKYYLLFSGGIRALEDSLPLELAEKRTISGIPGNLELGGEFYEFPQTDQLKKALEKLAMDMERLNDG